MKQVHPDYNYLKVLEKGPFEPLGWLYTSVYEGLEARGLVFRKRDGFHLSDEGRKALVERTRAELLTEDPFA